MISKTKKYLMCILIPLLICAVIAVAVYALHATAEEKMKQYEEGFAAAQVTVTVTTPTGEPKVETMDDGTVIEMPLYIPEWVYRLFTEKETVLFYDVSAAGDDSEAQLKLKDEVTPAELSLTEYVKDVHCMNSQRINKVSDYSFLKNYGDISFYERYYAYGITSLSSDPKLASGGECEVTWFDGYDESILAGNGLYCLVPNSKLEEYDNGNGEAVVSFYKSYVSYKYVDGELVKEEKELEVPVALKIVGTYTGGDWNSVYCPLSIVLQACIDLEAVPQVLSLSATLADNSRLEEFREKMSLCFLEPAPENEDIPWRTYAQFQKRSIFHKSYTLGLDIDDGALSDLIDVTGEVQRLDNIVKIGAIAIAVIIAAIPVGCLVIFLTNKKKSKAE
ncbi:MAG: hypothetical protein IKK74_09375 [Clostridia bacterium]|nr:hypothetical protein [Clostridia bacterium]